MHFGLWMQFYYAMTTDMFVGRDSSVGTATR